MRWPGGLESVKTTDITERMTGAMEKLADRLEARERSEEAGLVEMLLKESGGIQGLLGMVKMLKAGPA